MAQTLLELWVWEMVCVDERMNREMETRSSKIEGVSGKIYWRESANHKRGIGSPGQRWGRDMRRVREARYAVYIAYRKARSWKGPKFGESTPHHRPSSYNTDRNASGRRTRNGLARVPSFLVWGSVLNQKSLQGIHLAVAGLDGHGKLRLHDVSGALPWALGGDEGPGPGSGPDEEEAASPGRGRGGASMTGGPTVSAPVYLTFLGFLPL